MLSGEKMSFADEAEALFGIRPELRPLASYDPILAEIDALLPGEGSLTDRVIAFRADFVSPKDRLQPVMDAAIAECRRRTLFSRRGLFAGLHPSRSDRRRYAALLAELGLPLADTRAVGDGAKDIPMITAAGLGIGYHPHPAAAEAAAAVVRHHDLSALLWAQGYPRRSWVLG